MYSKLVSNDFFTSYILHGNEELCDKYRSDVLENNIGPDPFFEIIKRTSHHDINARLIKHVFSNIPINSSACGFVPGKSYYDFLLPHIHGYYFLRLDIKKFFHSISESCIRDFLKQFFDDSKKGHSYSPFDIAYNAVTHQVSDKNPNKEIRSKNILPIGFPSSPIISNIIFRKVDILIQKYCDDKFINYTRYADDMLFSSSKSNFLHSEQFQKEIEIYISLLSLKLKKSKRVAAKNTISLNGYVIQNKNKPIKSKNKIISSDSIGSIRISDKKLKKIKKLVACINQNKSPATIMENMFGYNKKKIIAKYGQDFYSLYINDQFQNKLKGYRSYLISLHVFNDRHRCVDQACLVTTSNLIKVIELNIK